MAVYADREHFANISFLTGFEPRFEEALLLLGPNGRKIVITGNENQGYARVVLCTTTNGLCAPVQLCKPGPRRGLRGCCELN